ncbi:MAG: hypothetical protein ACPG5W_11140, partial [Flavobacteriales bacterium]
TDFEKMPEWSSSFQGLEGDFVSDGKATSLFKGPIGGNVKFEHTIIDFEEGTSFGWSDPFLAGMKDHHVYKLETLENGNTRFIQTDEVKEGVTKFMGHIIANQMEKDYAKFGKELKARVESMFPKN